MLQFWKYITDKITKSSKIGLLRESFRAEFLQFSSISNKVFILGGWMNTHLIPNVLKIFWSCSSTCEETSTCLSADNNLIPFQLKPEEF